MYSLRNTNWKLMFFCLIFFMGLIGYTYADDLPWETPLCTLADSLTGTTAKAIAMIGLFVAGGLLVFGGELSDFARRITWMCLAISVMLAGSTFLDMVNKNAKKCPTADKTNGGVGGGPTPTTNPTSLPGLGN